MIEIGGTCKDCAHWRSHENVNRFGDCEATPDEHASISDHDGYPPQTGADFGCIHWVARLVEEQRAG